MENISNNIQMNQENEIDKDIISKWLYENMESGITDIYKIRNEFFKSFPNYKENLSFKTASKIDYEYNSTLGNYWMEAYSNPKRGDIVNIFGKDYYVKSSGIFTFSIFEDNSEEESD
jgi:hypothetical protein